MFKVPQAIRRATSTTNRWRGVEFASWAGLLLGIGSISLFTYATDGASDDGKVPIPTFLFPYLAAACVFITTCIWILGAARLGLTEAHIDKRSVRTAKCWFWGFFCVIAVTLPFSSGIAADPGANAVQGLNWYLFGPLDDPLQNKSKWTELGMPFSILTAFGIALSVSTMVYLGALCNGMILRTARELPDDEAGLGAATLHLGELAHRLRYYLIMASALMVTSTLTLYLLFGAAEQIHPLQFARDARSNKGSPLKKPLEAVENQSLTLLCAPLASSATGKSCSLKVEQSSTKRSSSAAYMALVAGLSFTGVLFLLFTSCAAILDDRTAELVRAAHDVMVKTKAKFSLKDWREQYGLGEAAPGGQVLQALALAAPALTGLLTLLSG